MALNATGFALAGAVIIAGCAVPAPAAAPARWQDTGTPPASVALEREVRYYRDSSGALWDDRGRRVEAQP